MFGQIEKSDRVPGCKKKIQEIGSSNKKQKKALWHIAGVRKSRCSLVGRIRRAYLKNERR